MHAITEPTENRAVCGMRRSSAYPPKRCWPMLLAPARTELVMFCRSFLLTVGACVRCVALPRTLAIPLFCLDCLLPSPSLSLQPCLNVNRLTFNVLHRGWRVGCVHFFELDNFMRRYCRNTRCIEVGRHNSIGYFVSTHHTFTWWTKRCPAGERRLLQNGCATLPKLAIAEFSFHRSTSAVRQHLAERR